MQLIKEFISKDLSFTQVVCGKDGEPLLLYKYYTTLPFKHHIAFKTEIGIHVITGTKIDNEIDIKLFEVKDIGRNFNMQEVTYSDKFNKVREVVKDKLNRQSPAVYYKSWCKCIHPTTLVKDSQYFCTICGTFIDCIFCSFDNICEAATIKHGDMYICADHLKDAKEEIENSTY